MSSRIIEWFVLEGTLKDLVQPPCPGQEHISTDEVAHSPTQPDLERFQWEGIRSLCSLFQCQDPMHLALLNFMRFTWAFLPSLSKPLQVASLPCTISVALLSLVSSANLFRVDSIPLPLPWKKRLDSTGPSTDPWGAPLITVFHLDVEPWTVTPWMWPFSHFLIHLAVHQKHMSPI